MFELTETIHAREFTHDDVPVLTLTLQYPVAIGAGFAVRRFNAFYAHLAQTTEKYAGTYLLPVVVREFERQRDASRPFRDYRVNMTYDVRNDDDILTVTRTLSIDKRVSSFTDRWDENGWIAE